MVPLVCICSGVETSRLRRYVLADNRLRVCTHAGYYDSSGVTPVNVEAYRQYGSPQDVMGTPSRGARKASPQSA